MLWPSALCLLATLEIKSIEMRKIYGLADAAVRLGIVIGGSAVAVSEPGANMVIDTISGGVNVEN